MFNLMKMSCQLRFSSFRRFVHSFNLRVPEDTTAQPPRKVRVTPIVLRDASRWRGVNHKFISLGIKFERAVAVDAGIRIIPKSEDDYRRIIRLFREEDVAHHTFPLPSERNVHAVIRGVHATLSEIEIKEELQQRGYSPLLIIRLKRGGGGGGSHTAQDRKISAAVQRTRAARFGYPSRSSKELKTHRAVSPLPKIWACAILLHCTT
ncbi:unnamed protein product [Acanthoscelides obtectus]|uniref:Uncharacterized protein n=1 Tax=Acanthoscelides obtectus TaxID=200917 RepID=A0A9P0L2N7_ACAOB|nr:unnamed protein product [Acanthoscelides obtectus]CAK1620346.1 hypothetical protein AOBTE_LOCUS329 [Acanthoscelides obtectus]